MKTYRWLFLAGALMAALAAAAQDPQKAPAPAGAPPQAEAPAAEPAKTARPSDNPLRNAAVGEWLDYIVRTESMGKPTELKARQTVTAKDSEGITLKTTGELGANELKVSLKKPYEPYMPAGDTDAIATKLGEGDETITVRGKTYACHWVLMKVWATRPSETDCKTKVWTSGDVPVTGVVKLESLSTATKGGKSLTTKLTMELVGFGK